MQTLPTLQLHPKRRQRLRLPAFLMVLAGVITAASTIFLADYYKSEVRILSDAGTGTSANLRAGVWAPIATPDAPGSREDGPTIIYADILKSRRMAEFLLQGEYDYPLRAGRFGNLSQVHGTLLDYLGVKSLDKGIGPLKSILVVQRDMKSGLLTLTVETRSPELSMEVAQRAARALKDFLVEISQSTGKNKADFTMGRLESVKAKFDEVGREFLRFQESNRDWETSPSPSVRFRGQRLKEDMELWHQVTTNLTLNHEQALLEARNDTQSLLILDPGNLPRDKSKPARAFIVFTSMLLTGVLSWIACNRSIVYNQFFAKEPAA